MLYKYKFNIMTTQCELQIYCTQHSLANSCAEDILKEAKRLEIKYNYFNKTSYLSKINQRDENRLDNETKQIFQRSKGYYKSTQGIFDITTATIKECLNLKMLNEYYETKNKLMPYVGCEHFKINKNKIYFDNDFTKIDLGGFVKEYAVDRAVGILNKNKIKSALVNFGGDLYVLGKKPNNTRFQIGIKNPINLNENLFIVELENQALTTSASYERNVKIEDIELSHIISKKEFQKNILSATVVANSCVESGIYSTVLMLDENIQTKNKTFLVDKELNVIS